MARLNPLYGRRRMLAGVIDVVEEWLASFQLDDAARAALRKIRHAQQEEVGSGPDFDVKRSPGAMADVEHLALGLTLEDWEPGMPRPAHIPSLLAGLGERGRLKPAEADHLALFYRRLRSVQVALQLHYGRDTNRLPADWGDTLPSPALRDESVEGLRKEAEAVRAVFDREFPA